jgi:glycosyltransferase involved in cell wall biosynthesis
VQDNSDKSPPLITLIVPTYKRPHMLKRTLNSVVSQTYPHFQACVYDNASQDHTSQIVHQFTQRDKRIKYHLHSENIGSNNNFQYGLKRANTPFFSFLADDDLLMPHCLEEAMQKFAEYPHIGIFVGKIVIMDQKKNIRGIYLNDWEANRCYTPRELLENLIHSRSILLWTSMIFRKEVIDKIGLLNPRIFWHDLDFLLRAVSHFSLYLSNTVCGIIHEHSSNATLSVTAQDFFDIRFCLKEKVINASFFSAHDKSDLLKTFEKETPKIILRDSFYSFFIKGRFSETLCALELIEKTYGINLKAKIIKWASFLCLKLPFLFSLIKLMLIIRKKVIRKLYKKSIKKKLPLRFFDTFYGLIKTQE